LFCHKNILAYEHGEPWWNDSDRGNSWSVHQCSLAILPAESSSNKAGGTGKANDKLCCMKYLCSYFKGFFNMP
jgi:hypothetical protein